MTEAFPRRFGAYLLTAGLGEDALGRVYRAIRMSGVPEFFRLRILEGPEISEDAILDAIEENGEIHSFLKNPAITRGVAMDAVEGVPFLAFQEENGRTLDHLLDRARATPDTVPYEHALLIAEKVATALEHAYNTMIDAERTLHGLVWPGFVALSDDGEIRLTGFGLAPGVVTSFARPRFAREVAPFLAPEERATGTIGRNSDVYSVGAILFALLIGRPPDPADALQDLKTARREGAPIAPEVAAVLRLCLAPAESRYAAAGDLRRELGKLLFSGPYAPSTFNLAFFLNSLFSAQIEAETNARLREAALGGETSSPRVSAAAAPPRPPAPRAPEYGTPTSFARERTPAAGVIPLPPLEPPHRSRRPPDTAPPPPPPAPSRAPLYAGGGLLVAAAIAGSIYLLVHRAAPPPPAPAPAATAVPATPTPEPPPTPSAPTSAMSEAQFKEEVARRVGQELKKIQTEMRRSTPAPVPTAAAAASRRGGEAAATPAAPARNAEPAPAPPSSAAAAVRSELPPAVSPARAEAPAEPSPTAEPVSSARAAARETAAPDIDVAPKILRVIKPIYPTVALRARIGGVVLLRVLVSETGVPADIQVVKGVTGGLTESAVAAVKGWRFTPASHNGAPIRAWTAVPIPFEP